MISLYYRPILSGAFSFVKTVALLLMTTLVFTGCEKDEPGGSGGSASGRFSDYRSTTIITPPAEVNLASDYTKYINSSGVPIVATAEVDDASLFKADSISLFMVRNIGSIADKMITDGAYITIYDLDNEDYKDYGEWGALVGLPNNTGLYDSRIPGFASPEQDLYCNTGGGDDTRSVFVHEYAHLIHISGIGFNTQFDDELKAAYSNARSNGLWDNTYSATNWIEYLGDGVMAYYNVYFPFGPAGGDGNVNDINTREKLRNYDPTLFNLIDTYFNENNRPPTCHWIPPLNDTSVTCPSTVTDIDGNTYPVVKIGSKCWCQENLVTTSYADGSTITEVTADTAWNMLTTGARCTYNNSPTDADTFGVLYNWYAIANTKGVCPSGWHVATLDDWTNLRLVAGQEAISNDITYPVKSPLYWNNGQDITNSTNFSALPTGLRDEFGFNGRNGTARFWVPTEKSATQADSYALFDNFVDIQLRDEDKYKGFSCRCVKN